MHLNVKSIMALAMSALLAVTLTLPVLALAASTSPTVDYENGEGDSITKLTLVAESDDNLAINSPDDVVKSQAKVQVPVAINYVAKTNGDIEGPADGQAKITNYSSYPVHVSNIAVTAGTNVTLVTSAPSAADNIQLFVTPGSGTQDQFGVYVEGGVLLR